HTGGFRYKGLKHSTQETRDIHHALRDHRVSNFHSLKINEKLVIDDAEVKALDAGHMLGSAQFLVGTRDSSVLYTGDINCVETLTTKPAAPVAGYLLVIDARYGAPH